MLGDRIGRKRVLAMTVLLMAGATTLIGVLPTYETIGLMAPLALALTRCVQGFSAGGEYAGACAFVMEHAPRERKARYGSFVPVSTFLAFASAAILVFALSHAISEEAMQSWGWRVPFLIAAPLLATWLIDWSGNDLAPAYYLVAVSVIALIGGLLLPESSKRALDDESQWSTEVAIGARVTDT